MLKEHDQLIRVADWYAITGPLAREISCTGDADLDFIYLYNDACVPTDSAEQMTRYQRRLAALMRVHVATPGLLSKRRLTAPRPAH